MLKWPGARFTVALSTTNERKKGGNALSMKASLESARQVATCDCALYKVVGQRIIAQQRKITKIIARLNGATF